MQQKLLQHKNKIIAAVVALVVLGGGYYWYSSSSGDAASTAAQFQPGLLKDRAKNFYTIKDTLNFDNSFMKGKNEEFYNQLQDYTVDIPLKDPAGRANPFVPYVAP